MRHSINYKIVLALTGLFSFLSVCVIAQKIEYPPAVDLWDATSLGNHRAVIHVTGNQPVAKGNLLWRRRDMNPEKKMMILIDSLTGQTVKNVSYYHINRESCSLYFQHQSGSSTYYLYYLPSRHEGSPYYPKDYYPEFESTASVEWVKQAERETDFAKASLQKLEAVNSFNSFFPMEIIATKQETDSIINAHAVSDYLIFPEDREYPIKMNRDLPYKWIEEGVKDYFEGEAKKGEYYAFQLGVFATKRDLKNLSVAFSDLKNKDFVLPDTLFSCINTEGVDYRGNQVRYDVNVPKGEIQPLWCYIKVPENASRGTYSGQISVKPTNASAQVIRFQLKISEEKSINSGVDEPWTMTRLPWLNSTLGQANTVITPYQPIGLRENVISILGRQIKLQPNGFPDQIQTFFPIEMTSISSRPVLNILSSPIELHIFDSDDSPVHFSVENNKFTKQTDGTLEWISRSNASKLQLEVEGHLEFDGFLSYTVRLIAKDDILLNNVNLDIPVRSEVAGYFMGLGNKGGYLDKDIHWKWDVKEKNQEGGWIGTVNAGLRFSLRDENYQRPLNTNFYLLKPLIEPTSWSNGGKGGINIVKANSEVNVIPYSGNRTMKKGDTLYYNFNLLITPFHALDVESHWNNRYYHAYKPIDSIKAEGGNVINIHQGNFINPYINYPFIATSQMKAYIDSAHKAGMKVKIYNTIRELANRAYELYPLFSMGHEIFPTGEGGGYPWLQEHLNGDYIAGWYTPSTNDAAIVNGGASRWHNYYIEGLNWLVNNVGIDGLYLDDVAFDRITMKRLKRELLQQGHPGLIDLHSANQHNKNDGWNNSAILYMSLFPYINRLWFGEYFDYENNGPDFYMTEVSGIPYGLMGEMLQDGGNPWRGILYGMTSRAPWTDSDPRPFWKLWDDFGIEESEMIGYWVPNNPVKTNNENVIATIFKRDDSVLIAIASWAKNDVDIRLNIDWNHIGVKHEGAQLVAPEIKGLQKQERYKLNDPIKISKNKGTILILK